MVLLRLLENRFATTVVSKHLILIVVSHANEAIDISEMPNGYHFGH